jgi:regulator of extracellular matrix RemA (YlzA/DUF370 family)
MSSSGPRLIDIGCSNLVQAGQVVCIVHPESAPIKRLRDSASKAGRLINACQGKKARSVIVTASNHVIEASAEIGTLARRYNSAFAARPQDEPPQGALPKGP